MGFWTSSRSFSLRKISLDQKLEIFMSKNFFFEKKMNPATANLQGCGMEQLQGTPQELLKNFMRWSQKNYLILFGSMAATTICLSFNYFQKSFFLSVWSQQQYFNSRISSPRITQIVLWCHSLVYLWCQS